MRASRLLRLLLILQNRGRQTSVQLAEELEVAPRTILRDVDAMTEAGLPVIVYQGNQGGIELGFNYRTRLTGLDADEAEALALHLSAPHPALGQLDMASAFESARAKLIESFPDTTRRRCADATARFSIQTGPLTQDPYVTAMAEAVRDRRVVRLRARSTDPQEIHPAHLGFDGDLWAVTDIRNPDSAIPQDEWGDLNISARRF
ncbi:HTH domain-containing protein [Rhodophyticola sp. CCM32]|uniref:helix-turn-helix transcriptional regulator n=1 Tax=Rhodophyticola sp. CCM32 TaxID=2916397 RepID=UPI00107F8F3B|nr:HTH domain-containing protein [Rhodophyticola sp. CCM32]QBY02443.1 HTH domain-containing protein [Rhodophyticola sp. CCM32]